LRRYLSIPATKSPQEKLPSAKMLNVGLIGLGPEWECRYWPALAKLQNRMKVRCVCTPVITHAAQVSAELGCDVAPGLMALIEREDVQALLLLDPAWYMAVPLQFACHAGKPAFLAGRFTHRLPVADHLLVRAAETGVTLMPDCGHRYTPATSRLRELMAARLGRPRAIVADVGAPDFRTSDNVCQTGTQEVLAETLDWCANLVGTAPALVRVQPANVGARRVGNGSLEMHVEFRRRAGRGDVVSACIRVHDPADARAAPDDAEARSLNLRARVECVHGTAVIEGPRLITWESGREEFAESLAADRPDVEVMLDHFSRRVVGGLIPVPTLEDLCRAYQLVEVALSASDTNPQR
jgi:predicted dehydrogenase